MKSITESVKSFFKQKGMRFEQIDHSRAFKLGFAGHNGRFLGYLAVDEEERTVLIKSISPAKAPKNKMSNAAELIARINRPLLIGNFELDIDTGLITYKTSIILGDSDLHNDILENLLFANWFAMDRYFPAFNLVIFGDVQPKKAIEMIRKSRGSGSDNSDEDNGTPKTPSLWLRDILGGSMN
jgi:hypothetical protein